jgi:glycosyltransferase involved in cell wall biosynthesis
MAEDLVHVWMVTYNHEKFIAKAIESVLCQRTTFKFKLIIGEDCSTDNTREIVLHYARQYPNQIHAIFNEQNLGGNKNARQIYRACTAKYVALLEGDDYWIDETKLQKQVDYLEKNPQFSMCFSDSLVVDANGNTIKAHRVAPEYRRPISQHEILKGFCPPANTSMLRNAYLKEILKTFPKIVNGDFYISALMTSHGLAGFQDSVSAAYRIHGNGVWAHQNQEYQDINLYNVSINLLEKVQPENKALVAGIMNHAGKRLEQQNIHDQFLEDQMWTPQTAMLRAIRDIILKVNGTPANALSIDENPVINRILLRKWPALEIITAKWPEVDAQDLHSFPDKTFDIVFSHQVLEHIPKPWIAAKEMTRVLKMGGIGIHTTCAFNPKHGPPAFNDYYRFLPDGLEQIFDGVRVIEKAGWGSKQALVYNLTTDDGFGELGGRRLDEAVARFNDERHPWHTWIIYQKA